MSQTKPKIPARPKNAPIAHKPSKPTASAKGPLVTAAARRRKAKISQRRVVKSLSATSRRVLSTGVAPPETPAKKLSPLVLLVEQAPVKVKNAVPVVPVETAKTEAASVKATNVAAANVAAANRGEAAKAVEATKLATARSKATPVPNHQSAPVRSPVATPAVGIPVASAPPIPIVSRAPARRWPLWVGVGSVAVLLAAAGGVYATYVSWKGSGSIAPNTFIAGQAVGGLTRPEAQERLKDRFGKLGVTVRAPGETFRLSLHQIGGAPNISRAVNNAYWFGRSGGLLENMQRVIATRWNEQHLNLPVRWDKERLKTRIRTVAKEYRRPARDAVLVVTEAGVSVTPERMGRALNVGETLARLQRRYSVHLTTLDATVIAVKPRLSAADLQGADVELGRYTTWFDRGLIGRTRNIRVASAAVNGRVLMPGDTFSFNASTGERTWEKGYRMAHIFEHKPGKEKAEVVDGLAGGVCQVSSTLFNAVRKGNKNIDSGLKILQRESHSLPVTYVPSGLDATVAWPHRDFKFRNTLSHPVYIRSAVNGSRLTIGMWARVPQNAATQFVQTKTAKTKSDI